MMQPTVYDERQCFLGEGPLWHPVRQQLFWFDIINKKLLSRASNKPLEWQFDQYVSAAGWIDHDHILIASETGLSRFNVVTGTKELVCSVEANRPDTRSNDGRADPWGGFWIGTMSKTGELGRGTIYRWAKGELREIESGLSTPNSICFDQQRCVAYYADTKQRLIWRQGLDPETGWPTAAKKVFLDLSATDTTSELKPDGAVVDKEGCIWNAQWGSSRVARYSPDGKFLSAIELPTGHVSCPAFGGDDMKRIFVTTAQEKLPKDQKKWLANAGKTMFVNSVYTGLPSPKILI